jgi:hypothetical protein
LSQWTNIKKGMRIPEQQLVAIAATYMEDPARQWYDSLGNMPEDWEEFSDLLVDRFFSPEVQRQWINSLRDMRQGPDQSVEDLAGQLDLHFTRLNVCSDSDKCNHLLNVLEPEIGDELLINPQQDYESSVRAAIRFETVLHRRRDRETHANGMTLRPQWNPPVSDSYARREYQAPKTQASDLEMELLTKKIQALEISLAELKSQKSQPPQKRPNQNQDKKERVFCWKCHQEGHYSPQCPQGRNDNQATEPVSSGNGEGRQ